MRKINYSLRSELGEAIGAIAVPDTLSVRIRSLVLKTKKGQHLRRGGVIAEHPVPSLGPVHAAAAGKVADVDYHRVAIKCDSEDDAVEPVDISSMGPGKELRRILHDLGLNVAPLSPAEVLVVNGLNPEPGITVAEQLLRDERNTLEDGLRVARMFIMPSRTVLAVARGSGYTLEGVERKRIKPVYPNSLDALAVKAVTGKEFPSNTKVLSVMDLYHLGRAIKTGLPVTDTVMTIAERNYRVPVGTPIHHLCEVLSIDVHPHDIVVLGGPLRGDSVYSLEEGVKKDDYGLFIFPAGAFPAVQDATCINCGYCVDHCPARLQPNMLSRYAEYEMFELAEKHGLNSCFECGLCAFNCFSRRPLLQYMRFAKEQLKAMHRGEGA